MHEVLDRMDHRVACSPYPATPRLSASIVTYGNPVDQIDRALASLNLQSIPVEVILVDNAGDPAVRRLAEQHGATYRRPRANLGYGGGHNLALEEVLPASDFHLVLNPDVSFDGSVLEALLTVLEEKPDIGLIMPKVLYPDGATQFLCKRLPTPWDLILRRFAPPWMRRRFRRVLERYEMRDHDYDVSMEPPTLSGCFMLMRVSTLQRVGIFDRGFFMYFEDVDLVRRIRQVARTFYYPEVCIRHEYQKGSYKSVKLALYHLQSAIRYFSKWGWLIDRERHHINRSV